jgi:hypothetical protein
MSPRWIGNRSVLALLLCCGVLLSLGCGRGASSSTEVVGSNDSATDEVAPAPCADEQRPAIPDEIPATGHVVMEPSLTPGAPLLEGRETNEPRPEYAFYPADPKEAVVSIESVLEQARPDYLDLPRSVRLARVDAPNDESGLSGRVVWVITFQLPPGTESPALGPSVADADHLPRCIVGHVTGLVEALVSFGTQ